MMKNKTQKGFTLIELLMVVALIAILSTVILVQLDTGRERAEVNKYLAYGSQMHKLVADSVAAGQFDRSAIGTDLVGNYCLGSYSTSGCGTSGDVISSTSANEGKIVFEGLTYLGEFPDLNDGNGFSPYDDGEGVYMHVDRPNDKITVYLYLIDSTGNEDYIYNTCKSIAWTDNGDYCQKDVPLHSRL